VRPLRHKTVSLILENSGLESSRVLGCCKVGAREWGGMENTDLCRAWAQGERGRGRLVHSRKT